MDATALHWVGHSLVGAATAALLAGCTAEASVGPDRRPALAAAVDLRGCENLQVPAGSKLSFRVYATGVQIYRWNGTSWLFVEPSALLFANAEAEGVVGVHYLSSGPTWQSVSGSKVVGAVLERCTPDPNAIPWLLLRAVSADGPGIFQRTVFIQRVNTVGGKAPSDPGSSAGEVTRVPYTAEYLFYRGQ